MLYLVPSGDFLVFRRPAFLRAGEDDALNASLVSNVTCRLCAKVSAGFLDRIPDPHVQDRGVLVWERDGLEHGKSGVGALPVAHVERRTARDEGRVDVLGNPRLAIGFLDLLNAWQNDRPDLPNIADVVIGDRPVSGDA